MFYRTLVDIVRLYLDDQLALRESTMIIIYLAWWIVKWLVFCWIFYGTVYDMDMALSDLFFRDNILNK